MADQRPATSMKLSTVTQDMVVTAQTVQATQMEQTAKDVEKAFTVFQTMMTAFHAIVINLVNFYHHQLPSSSPPQCYLL